jgi:hypothetical protein
MPTVLLDETAIIGQAFAVIGLFCLLAYFGGVVLVWNAPKSIVRTLCLVIVGIVTLLAVSVGYAWFGY